MIIRSSSATPSWSGRTPTSTALWSRTKCSSRRASRCSQARGPAPARSSGVRSTLHVNSRLEPGTTVPIGWIAAGDPALLFSPDRHDDLWAVQEPLDFPGTVYGVPRGTSMREIMRRQSEAFGHGR